MDRSNVGTLLVMALAVTALSACDSAPSPAVNPRAADACVPPGNALVARALLDQANAALAHADAKTAVVALEAGLAKIGETGLAAPTMALDDTGMKIEGVRGADDVGKLASVEQRVLAARLADYERYCGH